MDGICIHVRPSGVSCATPSGDTVDALGDFLPFLLAAGYLLIRFVTASRRQGAEAQPPQPPPRRRKAGGPTPFEQLVARLEEQAGAERPAPALPANPPPVAPPAPPPRLARPSDKFFDEERAAVAGYEARAAQASAFRPLGAGRATDRIGMASGGGFAEETAGFGRPQSSFEHERHGFGSGNPYSEEVFESSDARRPSPPNRLAYDPHGTAPPRTSGGPAARRLANRLKSPEAIREAFVLQTILTRPTRRRRS